MCTQQRLRLGAEGAEGCCTVRDPEASPQGVDAYIQQRLRLDAEPAGGALRRGTLARGATSISEAHLGASD